MSLDLRLRPAGAALICLLSLPAAAVENTPIVRMDASGGQIFLSDVHGRSTSFAGSGDWLFGDGMKFSDADTLILSANGQYQRLAQVNQIAGGGTLTTETMDDTANARWVRSIGSWDLKPNLFFKNELVTISNQESLGGGLYDLNQGGGGVEAEWKGETLKLLKQDLSASKSDYYHYQAGRSTLFGQELLLNNNALNFISYNYSIAGNFAPWEKGLLTVSGQGSYLDYPHQYVFQPGAAAGQITQTSRKRHDWTGTGLVSVTEQLPTMGERVTVEGSASFSADYLVLSSNQNNFDLGQSVPTAFRLNPDYYSYGEASAGPVLSLTVNGKLKISLSYNYAHRRYRDRPVQDSSGAYMGSKVWTDTHTVSYSFIYPLGKGFTAQLAGGYTYAYSNMHFENFYLYNYRSPYYFAGFGWAL